MPFKSNAQKKWANSPEGQKALGKEKLKEYNDASSGMKLQEKVPSKKKGAGVVSAPKLTGLAKVKAAAKRFGV